MFDRWKRWVFFFKRDAYALYLAERDPREQKYVKAIANVVAA